MSKNVAVFVDVANIFYAAKAAGVDIDYVTLLRSATAGRDFVRAYAYTGLDPENENQRQFHAFLSRSGFKVVSKDIRKYGDGRIKANLDIELVVDMMRMANHLDVCVVVSGDGDFAPAIRAVQQMGVRVEVVSFRGNTSSDLIEVADVFTDITQLARVEKGARSGRRVAAEGDLSMTAVPEKESEGAVRRRRTRRDQPAAAVDAGRPAPPPSPAAAPAMPGNLIVLPGERLSRADLPEDEEGLEAAPSIVAATDVASGTEDLDGAAGGGPENEVGADRRRRRRGGRGRGRGRRGEAEGSMPLAAVGADGVDGAEGAEEEEYLDEVPPPVPQHSTFGSVWDTQLGVPSAPPPTMAGVTEDIEYEDEDEPAVPEYLLAERRQRGRRDQRGGRASQNRPGYRSAVDRERYGRSGGGFGTGQMGQPGQRGGDRQRPSGSREMRPQQGPRDQPAARVNRPAREPFREPSFAARPVTPPSAEPWTEVPPEVQELLRAELARRGRSENGRTAGGRPEAKPSDDRAGARGAPRASRPDTLETEPEAAGLETGSLPEVAPGPESMAQGPEISAPTPRRRTARARTAAVATDIVVPDAAAPPGMAEEALAAPRRATRTRRSAAAAPVTSVAEPAVAEPAATDTTPRRAPAKRSTARSRTGTAGQSSTEATAGSAEGTAMAEAAPKPAPRRRATKRTSAATGAPADAEDAQGT